MTVWPTIRSENTDSLHQARVASRRIREALPVLFGGRRPGRLRKIRRIMRRITRSLGPIRELDVSLKRLQRHDTVRLL